MARKTPIQKEYTKQVARLRRAYNEARKQGYQFNKSFEEIIKPRKRITTSVIEKLKSIKPREIRKQAREYVDTQTGEVYNPKKQEKQIRRNISEKKKQIKPKTKQKRQEYTPPSFADIVIAQFKATLKSFPRAEGSQIMLSWLDKMIDDNGKEATAEMLQKGVDNGLIITREVVYSVEKTFNYMYNMMNYLEEQGEIYRDDIMEMMEQMESIEDWEEPV